MEVLEYFGKSWVSWSSHYASQDHCHQFAAKGCCIYGFTEHVLKRSLPSSASRMRTSRTTNPKVLLFTGIHYVIVLSTAFEYLPELWRLPLASLISQAHPTQIESTRHVWLTQILEFLWSTAPAQVLLSQERHQLWLRTVSKHAMMRVRYSACISSRSFFMVIDPQSLKFHRHH